jgi:hypothetical protein
VAARERVERGEQVAIRSGGGRGRRRHGVNLRRGAGGATEFYAVGTFFRNRE